MMKKYHQFFPLLLGLISVICMLTIFPNPANSLRLSSEDILSSKTFEAITDYHYLYTLLISIGILVPFVNNFIFALIFSSGPSAYHIELCLLTALAVIFEAFSMYNVYAIRNPSTGYLWNYHLGLYIDILILSNIIYSLQINSAKNVPNCSRLMIISTVLSNISFLLRTVAIMTSFLIVSYIAQILFILSIICNIIVMYQWFQKFLYSRRCGLQTYHNDFFSFCEMGILTIFYIFQLSLGAMQGFNLTGLNYKFVTVFHMLLIVCFYGIVEIYFFRMKIVAESSVEALETKRAFVRYVSHEIRTPLNAACMGLTLLDQEIHKDFSKDAHQHHHQSHSHAHHHSNPQGMSKEALIELVADVNQACNIAVDILSDLLLYEKIDGGLLVLEAQEIMVSPFVQEVLKLFAVQAKASDIEIVFQNQLDAKVFVQVDSYKMSQVLRNLVSNALKFSKPGSSIIVSVDMIENSTLPSSPMMSPRSVVSNGASNRNIRSYSDVVLEEGRITEQTTKHSPSWTSCFRFPSGYIKVLPTNKVDDSEMSLWQSVVAASSSNFQTSVINNVRISAQDFGAGISKENQKRLFKEIVQFDANKLQQGKGSGIGLWISNKIMKLHGGKIGVFSEGEGSGCTFSIDIPVSKIQPLPKTNRIAMGQMLRSILAGDNNNPPRNSGERVLRSLSARGSNPPQVRHFSNKSLDEISQERNSSSLSRSDIPRLITASAAFPLSTSTPVSSPSNRLRLMQAMLSKQNSVVSSGQLSQVSGPTELTKLIRVLVIDDSGVNRKMLKNYLRDYCDQCDEAVDGVEGLEKVKLAREREQSKKDKDTVEIGGDSSHSREGVCNGYDIVITDYMMPRMNGIEVVEQLRAHGFTGKIIGLTGNTETTMMEAFEKAGANKMLIKPIQGRELQEIIQSLLGELTVNG